MSTHQTSTDAHSTLAEPFSAAEENKLDAAMRKADEILVASLKGDERRRGTRRLMLLFSGGPIMIAAGVLIFVSLLADAPTAPPAKDQAEANVAKAEDLTTEGWNLWKERKLETAETIFEQAVKLDPKQTNAWNGLGWSRLNQGKRDEAVEAFTECVKLDPNHGAALNGLGWIDFGKKDYAKAEEHWSKANAPAAWSGLAQLYLLQGNWDNA